ncbi:MAG: TerB family tellurite resistance protein [Minwuia sp.]|nr:TerB family tellurite resistance protein [Minwuia sp.]
MNRVTSWLERLRGGSTEAPKSSEPDDLHLAAAILLIEAARLDGNFDADEEKTVRRVLADKFQLSTDETTTLIDLADTRQQHAVEISTFTRAIKEGFPSERRVEVIEMLWEVVLADGELHAYEANLLRRIGGLIYVSDRDNGEARQRVVERRKDRGVSVSSGAD